MAVIAARAAFQRIRTMRVIPSPPEALAGLAVIAGAIALARIVFRAAPDIWVLINALAQPSR